MKSISSVFSSILQEQQKSIIKNKSNIKKHEIAEKGNCWWRKKGQECHDIIMNSLSRAASTKSCKIFFNKHEEGKFHYVSGIWLRKMHEGVFGSGFERLIDFWKLNFEFLDFWKIFFDKFEKKFDVLKFCQIFKKIFLIF